jgi:flagellar biosynthesis protein
MSDEKRNRPVAAALSYKRGDQNVPRVIATGRGELANRIVELGFQNGIKVREDKDLAELLTSVDVGCDIPTEALLAVAEIIAYLYRSNDRIKSAL